MLDNPVIEEEDKDYDFEHGFGAYVGANGAVPILSLKCINADDF